MDQQAYIWLRPRRFGKSLFLNTLDAYYNQLEKDNFEKNFGHLFIGKNKTSEQGSYNIFRIDFSSLETTTSEIFRMSLHDLINRSCIDFSMTYKIDLSINKKNAIDTFANLMIIMKHTNKKVVKKHF